MWLDERTCKFLKEKWCRYFYLLQDKIIYIITFKLNVVFVWLLSLSSIIFFLCLSSVHPPSLEKIESNAVHILSSFSRLSSELGRVRLLLQSKSACVILDQWAHLVSSQMAVMIPNLTISVWYPAGLISLLMIPPRAIHGMQTTLFLST